jgi:uncharacterized SAM-binding protein YcdF (DUF218 family)
MNMKLKKKKHFIIRTFATVVALAGIIWFCIPFHWNVHNVGNITGIAVCTAVLLASVFYPQIHKKCSASKTWRIVWRGFLTVFVLGMVWSVILTGLMISGMTAAPPKQATVVVLGSKVSGTVPSADLRVRIEAAGAYLKANPQAKCIVSGGQGAGELKTEASVMKEYLVKQGIDSSRILTEDQSTTTEENLKNSLQIIKKNSLSDDLAIVTDEYHEFRAGKIAQNLGVKSYAVSAHTPWYIFSACWARELLALTKFLIIP